MEKIASEKTTLCPSARPQPGESLVFGVIGGTVTEPRVAYLKQPQTMTEELIAKVSPATPAEVFRTASTCATNNCQHFDGQDCGLVTRIVAQFPIALEELPPCSIRRDCRWWQQEGKAACMRCPQVITDNYNASELMIQVATPTVS
ncbi:nitrogen fixation protein [Nodularia spumigena CS-591/04]|uniref:nitrogen fixation protein n=1 Tax=Nodularia spumigena TaxID=70799 RepID=UPI00232CA86E|nr:nitrogen fixation protein [Nodularia spumigena]MDB9323239.1 nitrogen fixation protein [Nodularia spumigena CS-591/07A]MDB9331175.1 nitrogen fixation protein [Nodularia spumigena CS-591/04]MDB9358760.1 nitrogen fixation protein [Nodularia spumigena CS-588/02]MDB9366317.1 nitrogen fixation protein [Nodularia spumigena CS-588/02A10]